MKTIFIFLIFIKNCISKSPNILLIIADDLGFYDNNFEQKYNPNANKIPNITPNLSKLSKSGTYLKNYYVQTMCTPTRSALLSSRHPIRDGIMNAIGEGDRKHMPLYENKDSLYGFKNISILPNILKSCHYSTHIVGKWHLGHYKKSLWPTNRGFDSFYGYLLGCEDYYNRMTCFGNWGKKEIFNPGPCGLDFRENERKAALDFDQIGKYSSEVFEKKASDIIENHSFEKNPLFLYLPFQSVHYKKCNKKFFRCKTTSIYVFYHSH